MSGLNPRKLGSVENDVIYCTMDGVPLGMDVYYPRSGGPWPALIFVHGGGWTEGDKAGVVFNPSQFGYLVASINYRLYPSARFPAMIADVKCAIRYLRGHARQYNLDPNRIGLIGHSAGSHLVALAGLTDESAGWDVGPYLDQSSRVQAVIAASGPSDLTQTFPEWVEGLKTGVFGPEQLVSGSPVTYAHAGAPPFFIIHGDADAAIPVEQAYLLRDALTAAHVPVDLLILRNGGHGLEPVGGPPDPPIEAVYRQAFEFLDANLFFAGIARLPPPVLKWGARLRLAVGLGLARMRAHR